MTEARLGSVVAVTSTSPSSTSTSAGSVTTKARPVTTPGLTPLPVMASISAVLANWSMAEALVIDIGGAASHGAVVARELGLPYVIGTDNGTHLIHEGDQISVDGASGDVTVLGRITRGDTA